MTDVDDLDDITASYPVIVEYTFKHVVWVEAETAKAAAEYAQHEPYLETDDNETLATSSWEVREPDRWDWSDVYPVWCDGPYSTDHDAHVEMHRAEMRRQKLAADRAACTAAGHPDREKPIWDGRVWCKGCAEYLPAAAETEVQAQAQATVTGDTGTTGGDV